MSKPDQTELLPCPFCGEQPKFEAAEHGFAAYLHLACSKCGAEAGHVRYGIRENGLVDEYGKPCDGGRIDPPANRKAEASAAWNRRAVPALVQPEPSWEPRFDVMSPEQERLVQEFCAEIAGPRGKPGCPPDPVRLLEMAEALYQAERKDALAASPSASQPEPSDAMPNKAETPSTDAHETIGAMYRALGRGNNREAQWLAAHYLHAAHSAAPVPSPEPREPTPPSLPETVTDAQWMAEFERLLDEYASVRYDETRAALLAHIGKRPAMSEAQLTADEREAFEKWARDTSNGERWVMCNDCGTWKQMQKGNHHPWCGCGSDNFRWEDERDHNPEAPRGVDTSDGGQER